MADNFKNFKKAKLTLIKLVNQFYNISYNFDEAKELKIKYDERDIMNSLNYIQCVHHFYTPEGMYIWKTLGLKKPIYTMHEMWDLMKKSNNERENKEEDYYRKYLELCMINLTLIQNFYKYSISKEEAKKLKIQYDSIDEYDGKIDCLNHLFESAGESAWNLFKFEDFLVPMSKVYDKSSEIRKKLLKIDL